LASFSKTDGLLPSLTDSIFGCRILTWSYRIACDSLAELS
jgi:hypothetical protein